MEILHPQPPLWEPPSPPPFCAVHTLFASGRQPSLQARAKRGVQSHMPASCPLARRYAKPLFTYRSAAWPADSEPTVATGALAGRGAHRWSTSPPSKAPTLSTNMRDASRVWKWLGMCDMDLRVYCDILLVLYKVPEKSPFEFVWNYSTTKHKKMS